MEVKTVQSIAFQSSHGETIPSEYIRSMNEQPISTTLHGVILEVPVIDSQDENVVELIKEASRDWGIFQLVNHGIPRELIDNLQNVGKGFFDLPLEEKQVIGKTKESGIEGYGSTLQKEIEGKKGWVDHLFHKIWPPHAINYNFWPKNPPSYREATEEYGKSLREVSEKLIKWLSVGLELDEEELMAAMGGEDLIYLLKINYYPPCPRPDLALGVVAHTDLSTLTVLIPNEVQGLQVFRDDHWYDVKYIPNALIIHIGDQIEILSNGKYKAVLHRSIVNKEKARMSWPVFLEPPGEFEIGPIAKLVDDQNSPKYKTKKFKDYAYCKLNKLPQ